MKSALNSLSINILFKGFSKKNFFRHYQEQKAAWKAGNGVESWLKLFFIFLPSEECISTKIAFSSKFAVDFGYCTPLYYKNTELSIDDKRMKDIQKSRLEMEAYDWSNKEGAICRDPDFSGY